MSSRCDSGLFRGAFGTVAIIVMLVLATAFSGVARAEAPLQTSFALPDGRAYEQVTGPDKGGANVGGEFNEVHSAPDGNRLTFATVPTLPGSESAQNFAVYLASRSAEGWSTQSLLPSPTLGRESRVTGWSDDLGQSYSQSREGLAFLRDSESRSTTVVAEGASVQPVATAAGDSLFAFEAFGDLKPGNSEALFQNNVYVRNNASGEVRLASVMNDGEPATGGAVAGAALWPLELGFAGGAREKAIQEGAYSPDGRDLYFTEAELGQLYLRRNPSAQQSALNSEGECTQANLACTINVSASQRTPEDPLGKKVAGFVAANTEGPPVAFFVSGEKLTNDSTTGPQDEGRDLYRYEAETGVLEDLVPDTNPADPNGAEVQGVIGSSADGSRIYFVANGILGDGSTLGAAHGDCRVGSDIASVGNCNLYVWVKEHGIHFIGLLDAEPGSPFGDGIDWVPFVGGSSYFRTAQVSSDGRVLVFRSIRNQTSYDSEGVGEYYRYEEGRPDLACITCNPSGAAPFHLEEANEHLGPTQYSLESPIGVPINSASQPHSLSANGDRFVFQTGDKLSPGDINGVTGCPPVYQRQASTLTPQCQDVYEWEAPGTGTCTTATENGGCINLLSTGTSERPSYVADADATGNNVFFYTSQPLVAQDKDQLVDIYDARVGGGIASQNAVPPVACADASACKGSSPSPPSGPSVPGTLGFHGPTPLKCGKGFKKGKRNGKPACIKVHSHKKKRPPKKKHSARKKHGNHKKAHHRSGGSK